MHRTRKLTRIDKNVKRHMKHELGKDTMTGWLTKRRRTVQDLLNGTDDLTYIDEDIGDLAGWSESHQKEFNFQQNKALKGKIEAYNYGSLLEDEVEDDLLQAVEDAKEKMQRTTKRKSKRVSRRKLQTRECILNRTGATSQDRTFGCRACCGMRWNLGEFTGYEWMRYS